jgi:TetR/AcrR family transcriptional regulator
MTTTEPRDPRQRILDVATEIFAAKGFAGARVDEIAEQAGVNKAMLYYHVGDKARLYETVLLDTLGTARAEIEQEVARASTPEERLRAVTCTLGAIMKSKPHFPALMLREISSGGARMPQSVVATIAGIFRIVAGILADGASSGDFRRVDPVITHMLIIGGTVVLTAGGAVRQRMREESGGVLPPFPEPDPETAPDVVADILLNGINAPSPAGKRRSAPSRRIKGAS